MRVARIARVDVGLLLKAIPHIGPPRWPRGRQVLFRGRRRPSNPGGRVGSPLLWGGQALGRQPRLHGSSDARVRVGRS
eukprot:12371954-Alexandrium_andersonii.AAC.1